MQTASRVVAVLACLAGAAGSVYKASVATPTGEPLIVDEVSRHLGSIHQGGEARTTFHLRSIYGMILVRTWRFFPSSRLAAALLW